MTNHEKQLLIAARNEIRDLRQRVHFLEGKVSVVEVFRAALDRTGNTEVMGYSPAKMDVVYAIDSTIAEKERQEEEAAEQEAKDQRRKEQGELSTALIRASKLEEEIKRRDEAQKTVVTSTAGFEQQEYTSDIDAHNSSNMTHVDPISGGGEVLFGG